MDNYYKEQLEIKNFGPIKEVDINILPLTVFIGSQGTGKSTISKLLTICRDMSWQLSIVDNGDKFGPFKKFCIEEYFSEETYLKYTRDDLTIIFENGTFFIKWNGYSEEEIKHNLEDRILKANLGLLSKLGVQDIEDKNVQEKYRQLLNANARTLLYIPAERSMVGSLSESLANIIVNNIPLYDALIEYMSVFERAKNMLKTYSVDFLNARYVIRDGKEIIETIESDGQVSNSLPISACSSGLQSVLPLLMAIEYSQKAQCFDSFVIEEPEQNLFPENQQKLIEFLVQKLNLDINNLLITTHGPYVLSVLNNLVYAHQVGQKNPNKTNSIISKEKWLNSERIASYLLHDGTAESIIDEELYQIKAEKIDTLSSLLNKQFDQLMDLEYDGKE